MPWMLIPIRIRQNDADPTRQKKVQIKVNLNVFLGKCIFLAVTVIISLKNSTGKLPEANEKKDSVQSVDPSIVTQNGLKRKKYLLEGESLDVLYRGLNRNKEKSSLFKHEIEFFPQNYSTFRIRIA
jgi:hypothetical protein